MMILFFALLLSDKPVIHLDEVIIDGKVRKPSLIEIEGSKLNDQIEAVALRHLLKLERELQKPYIGLKTH